MEQNFWSYECHLVDLDYEMADPDATLPDDDWDELRDEFWLNSESVGYYHCGYVDELNPIAWSEYNYDDINGFMPYDEQFSGDNIPDDIFQEILESEIEHYQGNPIYC